MTRTHVILPDDVVAAIDELVGQRGRSSFLTEAAREAIKRRRLKSFLASDEVAWKSKDHPELADGAAAHVRAMRQEGEESDSERRGYRWKMPRDGYPARYVADDRRVERQAGM